MPIAGFRSPGRPWRLVLVSPCVIAARRSKQRAEHALQTLDERIRFAVSFQQRRDLVVLGRNLRFQKYILAFELCDITGVCRDQSRQVGPCRRFLSAHVVAVLPGSDIVVARRDQSRLVATYRDRSHLLDVSNVLVYRGW